MGVEISVYNIDCIHASKLAIIANMNNLDWDDLRFFLAIAEQGSLSAASRILSVNHSTVFRRINQLEKSIGVRLFERLADIS